MNEIATARDKAKLNQTQLAALVGVSRAAICRYESGSRSPERAIAEKLSKTLGIPLKRLRPDLIYMRGAV